MPPQGLPFAAVFDLKSQKKCVISHLMFEFCRKYTKLLIPILLGLFLVTFVIDDYGDGQRNMKIFFTECVSEIEADESECEDDDFSGDAFLGQVTLELQGTVCIFFSMMQLSSSKQSAEEFRGLVRRHAPRSNMIYNRLYKNGMGLIRFMPFFYF